LRKIFTLLADKNYTRESCTNCTCNNKSTIYNQDRQSNYGEKKIQQNKKCLTYKQRAQEEFEETKGVIRIPIYRRRTDNTMAKRKKYKRTNNIHVKLKIE